MSMPDTITITCPNCNNSFAYTTWKSINVTIDPAAKQKIVDGTFFLCTCNFCAKVHHVQYACLYHDMKQSLLIYLLANEPAKLDEINSIAKDFGAEYRLRIVTNENRLIEKVKIFDAGLEDRLVEVCKLLYQAHISSKFPDKVLTESFFDVKNDEHIIQFITEQKEIITATLEHEFYEKVRATLAGQTQGERTFQHIDQNWALVAMKL